MPKLTKLTILRRFRRSTDTCSPCPTTSPEPYARALQFGGGRVERQVARRRQFVARRVGPRLLRPLDLVGQRLRVVPGGPPALPPLQLVQRRIIERVTRAQHGEQQPVVVADATPDALALVERRLLLPVHRPVERRFGEQGGGRRHRLVPRTGKGACRRVAAQPVGGRARAADRLAGARDAAAVTQRPDELGLHIRRPPVRASAARRRQVVQPPVLQLRLVHGVIMVERTVVAARHVRLGPVAGVGRAVGEGRPVGLHERGERGRLLPLPRLGRLSHGSADALVRRQLLPRRPPLERRRRAGGREASGHEFAVCHDERLLQCCEGNEPFWHVSLGMATVKLLRCRYTCTVAFQHRTLKQSKGSNVATMIDPITVSIASAASTLHASKLFSKVAETLSTRLKGAALTAAISTLSSLEGYSRYLEETNRRVSTFKSFANPTRPVSLEAHFVTTMFEGVEDPKVDFDQHDLLSRLIEPSRVVISATAGYGKSMIMRYLALSLFNNPRGRIPLFVELREFNRLSKKRPSTIHLFYLWRNRSSVARHS